jgi:hypothetical protein
MYALARPCTLRATTLTHGTPGAVLAALALAVAGAWGAVALGALPSTVARAVSGGAAHGALLATGVAWAVTRADRAAGLLPLGIAVAALGGAVGAAVAPLGAVAYLWAPWWIWRRRAALGAVGISVVSDVRWLLGGVALGAGLGLHLALTASLTLGYRVGRPPWPELGPWLAYDAGANVLAAECFFRGALFDRAQRRWSFGAAAAISTAACVTRYLLDPLLPRTVEMVAGAAFYIGLLSVANCWLYRQSGSLAPGLLAGLLFFAVYRLVRGVA